MVRCTGGGMAIVRDGVEHYLSLETRIELLVTLVLALLLLIGEPRVSV
jgi:hypothetical protein